jgi:F-type H+-transporting ATPase subunit gamma
MATPREVKNRINSVKNISQVTRALQAVSASKVRKAEQAVLSTRPYALKAWQVLRHISGQPNREHIHPLLVVRPQVRSILVILITGDRGLAGAYNTNIFRHAMQRFGVSEIPVKFVAVGRKGRDLLIRRGMDLIAEFTNLPADPGFTDVSPIGHIAVEEFLSSDVDEVFLVYTDYISLISQKPTTKKLLPLELDESDDYVADFYAEETGTAPTYIYEPGPREVLDKIVPDFTEMQVYHAVQESLASEHAARMVAMRNATDAATELAEDLQLEYNKARQQAITEEMLDIAGGAEALEQIR